MSDQNGKKTEAGEPAVQPEIKSAATAGSEANGTDKSVVHTAGEADGLSGPSPSAENAHPPTEEPISTSDLEVDPGSPAPKQSEIPVGPAGLAERPARKGGALGLVAFLIGVVALGGGGYYLWNAYEAAPPEPAVEIAEKAPTPPAVKNAVPNPPESEAKAEAGTAPSANEIGMTPPKEPTTAEKTMPETKPPEPAAPPHETAAPNEITATTESKPTEASGQAESRPPKNMEMESALAAMAERLASTNAAIDRLSQRLQAVETQLAAPKSETRASLAERAAGPKNDSGAAARLVVAQSLLTALRQGDDYSAQLAAMQSLDANPERLARLRSGLSAPTVTALATEFTALAPKLIAAAKPTQAPPEGAPPHVAQNSVWTHLEAEARRLVRIRPANAPDQDAAAAKIEAIESDLRSGDLAAALANRQKLPASALAISDDWAMKVQARLAAESAARDEFVEALQNLTKAKS